jgi:hypothetical protein
LPHKSSCLLAAVLVLGGCGEANSQGPAATVTMKLPPPRPADARPGFSGLLNEAAPAAPAASRAAS